MEMKEICLVFGTACVLLTPIPTHAAAIATGASCSLLQAIESANTNVAVGGCVAGAAGPDTITVTTDVFLSAVDNGSNGLPVITEDLVITSAGPDVTRIIMRDAAVGVPEFRIMEIGTAAVAPAVTLSGLRMSNGRVTGPVAATGGCIFLRNGSLTLVDSILQECVAQGADNAGGVGANAKGGAIYAVSGSMSITNSSFSLNSATAGEATTSGFRGGMAEGGAIHASGLTSFVLENTTVDSNFALGGAGVSLGGVAKGGGIVFYGDTGSITASTFSANAAAGGAASDGTSGGSFGGAIVVQAATLTLTDTDLAFNVANGQASPLGLGGYAYGGALYASGSTVDIAESDVSGNRATGGPGSSSAFDGIARGGGLYLLDTTATIDHGSVDSNSISGANARGAGIAILQNTSAAADSVLITHSTVAANTAVSTSGAAYGGALYQEGDTTTIRNTTLADNRADTGGGLFQDSGTTVVTLSTFSNNTAEANGGAVAVDSPGFLSHALALINVTISGNSAGLKAGGLYITGAPLAPEATVVDLYNTVVTGNTNGGVHLVEDHTVPALASGNTIIGAQATGADCAADGAVTFTSSGGNLESGTSCAFTAASDQQSVADLGLNSLGSNGGETATHDLLPGSPAIDAGRKRICNRQANKKDQRGLARFYDGDGDRSFDCDSGAVEHQGLFANPGFEAPLDAASDWSLLASGGGDGRVRSAAAAPSGKFVFVFQANAALENLSQTVPLAGGSGETYTLSLLASGSGLTVGEAMTVTLESTNGGAAVDTRTCTFPFPSAAFARPAPACVLSTTGAYDALNVVVGWDGATTGSLALDALSLTRT